MNSRETQILDYDCAASYDNCRMGEIMAIDGTDFNQVKATVPASAAAPGGKVFVRLTGGIP